MYNETVFYQGQKVRQDRRDSLEQQDPLALGVLQDRPELLGWLDHVVQLV